MNHSLAMPVLPTKLAKTSRSEVLTDTFHLLPKLGRVAARSRNLKTAGSMQQTGSVSKMASVPVCYH